jgi:hypothetical protein
LSHGTFSFKYEQTHFACVGFMKESEDVYSLILNTAMRDSGEGERSRAPKRLYHGFRDLASPQQGGLQAICPDVNQKSGVMSPATKPVQSFYFRSGQIHVSRKSICFVQMMNGHQENDEPIE